MASYWVGTNWKMTKTISEGVQYTEQLKQIVSELNSDLNLFIIPSYTALVDIRKTIDNSAIKLGTQNMHWEDEGAFTGEISPKMLDEIGIDLVELGHSERRQYYNENDFDLNKKIFAALKYKIKPLLCIGESLTEKEYGLSEEILALQLKGCLKGITDIQSVNLIIAYEPIWAIGENGQEASATYVGNIHKFLRKTLIKMFPEEGVNIPILFGGSVNLENYLSYLEQDDVNGLFVGRCAWNIETFKRLLLGINQYIKNN